MPISVVDNQAVGYKIINIFGKMNGRETSQQKLGLSKTEFKLLCVVKNGYQLLDEMTQKQDTSRKFSFLAC